MAAQIISPKIEIHSHVNQISARIEELDRKISQFNVLIARNEMDLIRFWTAVRDVLNAKLFIVNELITLREQRPLNEQDFVSANEKIDASAKKIQEVASKTFMVLLNEREFFINEEGEIVPLNVGKRLDLHARFMDKVTKSISIYAEAYPLNQATSLSSLRAVLSDHLEIREFHRKSTISEIEDLIKDQRETEENIRPKIEDLSKERLELFKGGMKIDNLWLAAQTGDLDFIRNALERSTRNLNELYQGFSAAHYAAFNGQLEALKLLVSYGAKIDLVDYNNDLPFHWAVKEGNLPIIQHLFELKTGFWIFKSNDPTVVNRKGAYGRTSLHRAVYNKRYEAVAFLLEKDADCRIGASLDVGEDEGGETPIHTAIRIDDFDMIELLGTSKYFDVMVRDNKGYSALYHALERKSEKIAIYMINHHSFRILPGEQDPNTLSRLIDLAEKNQLAEVLVALRSKNLHSEMNVNVG